MFLNDAIDWSSCIWNHNVVLILRNSPYPYHRSKLRELYPLFSISGKTVPLSDAGFDVLSSFLIMDPKQVKGLNTITVYI
jgi:hypothetical protein